MAPLLIWTQREFGVDLEVALSMLVGHVKACRMNITVEGWPYNAAVVANSRTQIRDFVDFAWPLGLRVEPLPLIAIKPSLQGRRAHR
jgi:hypothetical protein